MRAKSPTSALVASLAMCSSPSGHAAPAPTSVGPHAPWPPGSSESGATAPAQSPASPHNQAWSTIPCPHIGQPVQKPSAAVEGQVHVGEIRKLPLPGGHDAVEGTEDRNGEASVGQPVHPAAAHVDALAGALGVPFLQLADQARQPRAGGVVLVATEAALQGGAVIPLHTGLDFVAFEAQGLELQGLSLVGLAHRNDVVQLAGLRSDGRTAELAHPVLFCRSASRAARRLLVLSRRLCSKCRKTSRLAPASRCPR